MIFNYKQEKNKYFQKLRLFNVVERFLNVTKKKERKKVRLVQGSGTFVKCDHSLSLPLSFFLFILVNRSRVKINVSDDNEKRIFFLFPREMCLVNKSGSFPNESRMMMRIRTNEGRHVFATMTSVMIYFPCILNRDDFLKPKQHSFFI